MDTFAFVTPSYAPDFELCRDLHESLLATVPASTVHHLVIPDRDTPQFRELEGPQCRIWPVSELVPRRFVTVPRWNGWVNVWRPWPPVRGWVMQQLVKLALTTRLDVDAVVLIDSDVVMARPVTAATFTEHGKATMYREVGAVHYGMKRHVVWHAVARRLLGLPPADPPLNDYVNALTVWDPEVVAGLQARIEEVNRRPWMDTMAANVHFSEDILYGVYVDEVLAPADRSVSRRSPCHCYWDTTPLDRDAAAQFATGITDDDVALMISAKSHTPLDVRRDAWRQRALLPHAARA